MRTDIIPMTRDAYQQYRSKIAYDQIGDGIDRAFIFGVYTEKCTNCGGSEPVDGRAFCKMCIGNDMKQNTLLCNKTDCNICFWRKKHMDGDTDFGICF